MISKGRGGGSRSTFRRRGAGGRDFSYPAMGRGRRKNLKFPIRVQVSEGKNGLDLELG